MNPVQIAEDRWFVKTTCHGCFIDVGYSNDRSWKFVEVSLQSNHVGIWNGRILTRIAEAWRILRGNPYMWFEFVNVEETDAFIKAVQIARERAFGPAPEPTTRIQRFRKWFSRATSGR